MEWLKIPFPSFLRFSRETKFFPSKLLEMTLILVAAYFRFDVLPFDVSSLRSLFAIILKTLWAVTGHLACSGLFCCIPLSLYRSHWSAEELPIVYVDFRPPGSCRCRWNSSSPQNLLCLLEQRDRYFLFVYLYCLFNFTQIRISFLTAFLAGCWLKHTGMNITVEFAATFCPFLNSHQIGLRIALRFWSAI